MAFECSFNSTIRPDDRQVFNLRAYGRDPHGWGDDERIIAMIPHTNEVGVCLIKARAK
jgi:hypothetical protein